ncbi:MAG TPA: NADP-dependent oxidoreductase [Ktedonobacteraceae bacterium]|nr:NADP-dependent oxidoreductase [Ktedonobacteraceae bacterium]
MATMKAIRIHEFGDADVMKYEDVEQPKPQAGEVLVRVRAAGINPVDYFSRRFPLPFTSGAKGLPYILGWDISGEVVDLGEGVTQFSIGDEVYGMPRFPGEAKAYSQYITSPVSDLALKPKKLSYQEAAGVPLVALTAWQGLFDTAHLQAGQSVFISGGAGGVGHLAIQLAKWKGAKVMTTTSTRNVEFVRSLGADVVVDYTQQSIVDVIKDVDVVLDTIGGDVLEQEFQIVKRGGWVVSLPGHKGVDALGAQLAPQYSVSFKLILVHPSGEQLAEIAKLFDANQLTVHLDAVIPLKDAAQAHKLSEGGHVRGKLVLDVE